jgi:hypothetical protein
MKMIELSSLRSALVSEFNLNQLNFQFLVYELNLSYCCVPVKVSIDNFVAFTHNKNKKKKNSGVYLLSFGVS